MLIENYYWLDYMTPSSISDQNGEGSMQMKYPILKPESLKPRKIIISDKFRGDVISLCEYAKIIELSPGMTINITLQEILKICPRRRPRIDSYNSLVRYLHEQLNVNLKITSNKSKHNCNEDAQ